MAIVWGPWEYGGGNGMRVGVESFSGDPENGDSSVLIGFNIYTENQYKYDDNQQILLGGVLPGDLTYYNGQYGGAVKRGTEYYRFYYPAGEYGVVHTDYMEATVTGAYNGVTPSVRLDFTIPARPGSRPIAPSNFSGTQASETSIALTWTNNSSSARPYETVTIQRSDYSGSTWSGYRDIVTLSGSTTSYVMPNLSPNKVYEFEIRANNSAGSSSYTRTMPNLVRMTPGAPTNVTARANAAATQMTVSWTSTAYTGMGVVYNVERSNDGGTTWASKATNLTGTSWTDPSPGVGNIVYRVAADHSTTYQSAWVLSNNVSTAKTPLAPSNLSPNSVPRDFTLPQTLTWQHNHGGDFVPQSRYDISYSANGGSTWLALPGGADVASSVSSHTIPAGTLTNTGATYLWRVRTQGVAAQGWSPLSGSATIVGSATPTATIQTPTAIISSMPIVVSWIYNQTQGSVQSEWIVELVDADTGTVLEQQRGSGTGLSRTLAYAAEDNQRLTVRVQVRSAAGLWSAVSSVTSLVAMPVPALVQIEPEYQDCTGTVRLRITPNEPALAPADRKNLATNPGFRTTSGTVVTGTNLVKDPSFEYTLGSQWTANGGLTAVQYGARALYGANALIVTMPTAAAGVATYSQTVTGLTVGRKYTLSAWMYLESGAETCQPTIAVNGKGAAAPVTTPEVWTRVTHTFTASATSHAVHLPYALVGSTVGQTILLDGVMLNEGVGPLPYFDGDTVADAEFTYAWTGTAGASSSTRRGRTVTNSGLAPYLLESTVGWQGADGNSQVIRPRVVPGSTSGGLSVYGNNSAAPQTYSAGQIYTVMMRLSLQGSPTPVTVTVEVRNYAAAVAGGSEGLGTQPGIVLPANGEEVAVRIVTTTPPTAGPVSVTPLVYVTSPDLATADWLPTATITGRDLVITAGAYDGAYFDGSTPNISTAVYTWDGTPNASTSNADGRAETPVDSVSIQRRAPGDGWVTLVEALAVPADFIDLVPSTNGLNEYKVVVANNAPTYRTMPIFTVMGEDGDDGDGLWVFLSYGPGFSRVLRVHGDLDISVKTGRKRAAQPLMGRRWPVMLAGENSDQQISVGGMLYYDNACVAADPADCWHDSPPDDWEEAAVEADLVCYRDYTGRRVFGILGDVSTKPTFLGGASMSFGVTRTDYIENYGLTVTGGV